MRHLLKKTTSISIIVLAIVFLLMLLLVPAEKTLGNVIKVVFLHAALVQVGLLLFAAAAALGAAYLIRLGDSLFAYCAATQKTALLIWILYSLSSMWVTYLAWGKAIAWEEPRVHSSVMILFTAVLIFLLVWWIKNTRFTAAANIVLGLTAWSLTKSAGLVQHPANPIARSDSHSLRWLLFVNLGILVLICVQVTRLFAFQRGSSFDKKRGKPYS